MDYFYDNVAIARGKLVKVSSSVSTTDYTAFDILGRVTAHRQTTDGQEYATGYGYDLAGALIEETYPSGRVVKSVLDNDGDLSMVQSKKGANQGFWNYAQNFAYSAAGAVTSMQLGNGRWELTAFNSRLQPTRIALGTTANTTDLLQLDYDYGTTQNNGNVLGQTITVQRSNQTPLVFNQTYVYDPLNRLQSAEEKTGTTTNWKQTYKFDRYGNRSFDFASDASGPRTTAPINNLPKVVNPEVLASNNQLKQDQDSDGHDDYRFDASGNMTLDPEARHFTYDAENKQTEVKKSADEIIGTYYFDGDGKRVKKVVPGTGETTVFVYDIGGKVIAEYSINLSMSPKVQYLTNDHLGTPRASTDHVGAVISRSDYLPFGEDLVGVGGRSNLDNYVEDDLRQGFTGYVNDEETGLDAAQARTYDSAHGRFNNPDPLLSSGRPRSPDTWNRYTYVLNNPLNLIDPDGLYECVSTVRGQNKCRVFRQSLAAAKAKLASIEKEYGPNSDEYTMAKRALDAFGCESKGGNCVDENGKTLQDANGKPIKDTSNIRVSFTHNGPGGLTTLNGNSISVNLTRNFSSDPVYQAVIGNEGTNAADMQEYLAGGDMPDDYTSEYDSARVQAVIGEFVAKIDKNWTRYDVPLNPVKGRSRPILMWSQSWEAPDKATLRTNRHNNINTLLKESKEYLVTPSRPNRQKPL